VLTAHPALRTPAWGGCLMSRESAETKGRRYLTEGRLLVIEVGPA